MKWKSVPLDIWIKPDPQLRSRKIFIDINEEGKFRKLNTRSQKYEDVKTDGEWLTIVMGTLKGVPVKTRIRIKNIYWKCFRRELMALIFVITVHNYLV